LELSSPTVAADLALDEALLQDADAGQGGAVIHVWEPSERAVVLGASCRIRDDVFLEACAADGVKILRRTSGGGTVLVGPGVLCVTVILPEDAAPLLSTVDGAQRYVLEWLAASIASAGTPVTLAGRGDLVLDGRKVAGSAQRRLKHWFMVHCSILYDFAIEPIARYLAIPRRQPDYRAGRNHHDFLCSLGLSRNILSDAIRGKSGARATAMPAPELPAVPRVQKLVADRFANPAWVERF
jgi:lipoate-protein ligase A